eukprot:1158672-Pelagomonas_calceolata.AAC.10
MYFGLVRVQLVQPASSWVSSTNSTLIHTGFIDNLWLFEVLQSLSHWQPLLHLRLVEGRAGQPASFRVLIADGSSVLALHADCPSSV